MTIKIPSAHELILFRKRKEPSFAIFNETIGKKANIFSEEGKDISVDIEKIAYNSGIIIQGNFTPAEKKLKLREIRRNLEEAKDKLDIETLWECIGNEGSETTFKDILDLYFGDADKSNDDSLTLFWAVDKDDIYFKRGEAGYTARDASEVKELITKKETEKRREKERAQALLWAKKVISGNSIELKEDFDPAGYIDLLRNYVIHLDKYNRAGEAKSFLSEIGIKDVEGAIEFLIKTGSWLEDEDPLMERFSITQVFPKKVVQEAEEILNEPFSDEYLEDLTNLEVFSVDDENTQDIDDAISIEETDVGTTIGIHIANVAQYVPKWSAMDDEAARRGETVYLPEHHIHMFPSELIKERLSLVEGTKRKALSLLVDFDNDYNLKGYRFTNSKILIRENISYEKASEYFSTDPLGNKIKQIAENLRAKRLDAGALIIQLPQLKISIDKDSNVRIKKNYMNSVAHKTISEFMILMNRMAGKFLKENNVPGIYRSQPEPISEDARSHDENDPLFAVHVVKYLRAPRVGLDPAPHLSLGIDIYAQATSPIRRYVDLIIQRQIVSKLENDEPSYSEDELENLYPKIEIGIRDKKMVERNREKYWVYKHLKTLEGTEINGIINSINDSRASVYLPDYLFEIPVLLGSNFNLEEDRNIKLVVQKVDPLRRKLSITPKIIS
ncbi:MAG: ribonuclease [Thermodesulfobacteriota bacterium]|nr:MAG: ribonuclease [Thermodesulfobacteriota bacterium]